jgi:hypothetical protein
MLALHCGSKTGSSDLSPVYSCQKATKRRYPLDLPTCITRRSSHWRPKSRHLLHSQTLSVTCISSSELTPACSVVLFSGHRQGDSGRCTVADIRVKNRSDFPQILLLSESQFCLYAQSPAGYCVAWLSMTPPGLAFRVPYCFFARGCNVNQPSRGRRDGADTTAIPIIRLKME